MVALVYISRLRNWSQQSQEVKGHFWLCRDTEIETSLGKGFHGHYHIWSLPTSVQGYAFLSVDVLSKMANILNVYHS